MQQNKNNNQINKMILFAILFVLSFSVAYKVNALPTIFYDPGVTLMPSCAPGTCTVRILPDQSGNAGKFLTTDGLGVISWQNVAGVSVSSVFGRTGAVTAQSGDYTTTQVTEGTNLYFTEPRVLSTVLAGFVPGAGTVTAADSVIDAIEKLAAASHDAVTIGTGNGLSLAGQALSLALSSTGTTGALSATDWNTFNNKVGTARTIATGTGLQGGGDLSADRTLSLADTAVAPGSYGSATQTGTFTVDAQGRLTAAGNTTITPLASSVTGAQNVTAGSSKIALSGTPTGATLQPFSIDINEGNVNLANLGGVLGLTTQVSGVLPTANGGTGLATLGTAGQVLTVNPGGTALIYATPAAAPVSSVFGRTGAVTAQSGDYTTTQVTEGTNLYFTEPRVLSTVLAGFVPGAGTVTAADSVIDAIEKLAAASHDAVTIGTGNGLSLAGQALSLALSSTGTTGALSATDWNTFNNKVGTARTIATGTGLQGGGDLSADRTLSLADTAVAPGSYGSATQTGTFTVDAQGRLTAAGNTTITPLASSVTGAQNVTAGSSKIALSGTPTGATLQPFSIDINEGNVNLANLGGVLGLTTQVSGVLPTANGGTGLATLGTAGQVLTVNPGGTALIYATPAAAPVSSVFGRTGAVTAQSGDYTTTQVTEGTNLYFTEPRVLSTVLAGFVPGAGTVTAADSVIDAIEKLAAASHDAVTIGTGNGLSLAGQALSLALSSTGTTGALSATDWNTFNNKVGTARTIATGTGLQGGGDLSADRTLSLADTAVAPGSYGSATQTGTFTVDAQGRLTAAGNTTITPLASSVTGAQNVTAGSSKIALSGTPTGATLQPFSIDINEGNVNLANLGGVLGLTTQVSGVLPTANGGTGLATLGTAGQVLTVNPGGTALIYATPAAAPVSSVFGRTGAVTAQSGDYTTTQVTEGTNLYFTEPRVLSTVLAGFVPGAGTVTAADSVIDAIEKLAAASHDAVTIGTGNGLSLAGQALSLALSSTGTTGALSATDWNTFNNKVGTARTIATGTGLQGGGDLSADRTLSLADTAVAPGSYGSATQTGTFTVDAQGRLTAAGNTTITPLASSVTGAQNVTAGSSKIALSGTPTGATLQPFSIDINEGNVNLANLGGVLGLTTQVSGVLPTANGGTGLATLGTAGQVLTVNPGGTALIYATPAAAPVSSVFGRTGAVTAQSGDYTTTQVTEGTNLYFTEPRVLSTVLAGFVPGAGTVTAADSVIDAIEKLAAASHDAVTIGTGNGLSLAGQALSLALSSTGTTGALSATDWNTFNNKVGTARTIATGTGLQGGGDLSADRTLSLADTAVAPGSYGSATQTGTFTVDAQGRLTAAGNTTITPLASSVTGAQNVTAGSSKIALSGTPTGATLQPFSIDINEGNVNLANLGGVLGLTTQVSGVLPTANGGTGLATLGTAGQVLTVNPGGTALIYATPAAAPVSSVFGRTGAVTAQSGDYTTTQVTEGTNLYFTEPRVLSTVLAGFVPGAGTVTAADSVIDAIEKLAAASHDAVTIGTGNGLSLAGQALSLALSSTGTTGALSATDWNTFNNKVGTARTIATGTGLQGGGDLSADRTLSLADTAVAPGSYGSATQTGTFTVDAQGRLTAAGNTTITPLASSVTGAQNVTAGSSKIALSGTPTGATLQPFSIDINEGNVNLANLGGVLGLTTQVSGVLPTANGGTGLATYATGDIIYASATNTLSKLTAGTNGHVLTLAGGVPTWAATPTSFISSVGSVGASPNANGLTVSSGVLTLQPASATFPGVLTTGTQTIAGNKTWSGNITALVGFSANGSNTGTNVFVNGGNTFGSDGFIGTNDPFSLSFLTSGTEVFKLDTQGNILGNNTNQILGSTTTSIAFGDTNTIANAISPSYVFGKNNSMDTGGSITMIGTSNYNKDGEYNTLIGNTHQNIDAGSYNTLFGNKLTVDGSYVFGFGENLNLTSQNSIFALGLAGVVNHQLSLDGTSDSYIVGNSGNLGIGVTSPTEKLDIGGNVNIMGGIKLSGSFGTTGQVLTSAAGGVNTWTSPSALGSITLATGNSGTNVNFSAASVALGGTLTLNIPDASASARGLLTTGTQTLGGAKTFNSLLTGTSGLTITGGAVSLNASSNFGTNINTGTSTGAISIGNSVAGAVSIVSGSTVTITSGTSNALSLDSGTTGNILIGTGSNAKTITLGNSTGATALNLTSGTGLQSFTSSANSTNAFNFSANSVTTGDAFTLNTTSVTTGNIFKLVGPSSRSLLRVQNIATDPLDTQRVIIGEGQGSKPDTLARDQLYVFGRINTSWDSFSYDFMQGRTALSADGDLGNGLWFDEVSSSTATPTSVAGYSGILRVAISTAATNVTDWVGSAGIQVTQRSLNPVFETRLQGDTNNNHRMIVGFHQINAGTTISADTNNTANGAFFRKTAAGTNWTTVTRNSSGTETITNLTTQCSGACTTDAMRILRIEVENTGANGTVRFYIDGTLVATHSDTSVPAATNRLAWGVGQSVTNTTPRSYDLDYIRVWSDDPKESTQTPLLSSLGQALSVLEESIDINLSGFNQTLIRKDIDDEGLGQTIVDVKYYLLKTKEVIITGMLRVKEVVADIIKADKVETKELCIDDLCITKEDLQRLLEEKAQQNTSQSSTGNSNTDIVNDETTHTTTEAELTHSEVDTGSAGGDVQVVNEDPEGSTSVNAPEIQLSENQNENITPEVIETDEIS